jgi:FtsH-binding integral membrane protein
MDPEDKKQARELLIQARVYKVMAKIFVVVGAVVFIMLYIKNVEGSLLSALQKPSIILMLLIPFLPAIVLSRKAQKIEKKLFAMLKLSDDKATEK